MWRDANKIISSYKGSPLISKAGDFEEFFRVMELRQRKKQLSEFIIKISPILKELGEIYLKIFPDLISIHVDRKGETSLGLIGTGWRRTIHKCCLL